MTSQRLLPSPGLNRNECKLMRVKQDDDTAPDGLNADTWPPRVLDIFFLATHPPPPHSTKKYKNSGASVTSGSALPHGCASACFFLTSKWNGSLQHQQFHSNLFKSRISSIPSIPSIPRWYLGDGFWIGRIVARVAILKAGHGRILGFGGFVADSNSLEIGGKNQGRRRWRQRRQRRQHPGRVRKLTSMFIAPISSQSNGTRIFQFQVGFQSNGTRISQFQVGSQSNGTRISQFQVGFQSNGTRIFQFPHLKGAGGVAMPTTSQLNRQQISIMKMTA